MELFRKTFEKLKLTSNSIPFALFGVCLLAYGMLSPFLGFYQDDWNFVYHMSAGGKNGLFEFFNYDGHPTSAWSYIFGFQLLGFTPFAWQLYSFAWRYLAVLSFWWVIDRVWINRKLETFMSAVIFAIYPVFYLQAQALSYFEVWISFVFLFLSFYFSLRAIEKQDGYWPFLTVAIAFKLVHTQTSVYTWGLELMRPILLWIVINNKSQNQLMPKREVKRFLWHCTPYLLIFLAAFVWRGLLYVSPDVSRSEATLFNQLIQNPIVTIRELILYTLPDLTLLLVTGWYKILQPGILYLAERSNQLNIIFIIFTAIGLWIYLKQVNFNPEKNESKWPSQALLAGAIGLLFGLVPSYAAGYFVHLKLEPWNGRFALGSIPGIALITTGLLTIIITQQKQRIIIFALITSLAISWQVQVENQFRWAWDKQINFYNQLQLRAPNLKQGTVIISEDEFLSYMGGYPIALAINSVYTDPNAIAGTSNDPQYWYYPFSEIYNKFDEYLNGMPFEEQRANANFRGEPEGSIVISFDPGLGQCLWVMRPEYASSKSLSQTMRQLTSISYVDRIGQAPLREDSFLSKYLYTSPEQDWCYYYEKADLAYQYEEWDEVIQLWETARQNDLQPENGFEYLPFIEAYAHEGDWETAKSMTRTSQKTLQGIDPLLCNIWSNLEGSTSESAEKDEAILSVKGVLRCDQE